MLSPHRRQELEPRSSCGPILLALVAFWLTVAALAALLFRGWDG